MIPATGIPFGRLLVRSLRSVDLDFHVVLDPIRLSLSVPQAMATLVRHRPAAIFTTGGYVALPVLLAAWALRIPVVMWDGNVVPGRSVRVTARLVGCLAVTFESTCRALGQTWRPCFVTGTPIRDPRRVSRADARKALGIPAEDKLLLIFGGSQAVRRFNSAVAEALPRLVERARVIHVTGEAGYDEAVAGRDDLPENMRDRYRPEKFLDEDMTRALAAADLVVGRAGSSTLAEVAAFGLPMVVVPYPHAAGHQRRNAEEMVRSWCRSPGGGRGFRCGSAAGGRRYPRRPGGARRDGGGRPVAGPTRRRGRGGGARRGGRGEEAVPRRRSPRGGFPGSGAMSGRAREAATLPALGRGGATAESAPAAGSVPDWARLAVEMASQTGVRPRRNEPLAGHTSMRVGGPADLLAVARDVPALVGLVRFARAYKVPFVVLGRGSDVVAADAGIRALVILSRAEGWRIDGDRLTAEAGLAAGACGDAGPAGRALRPRVRAGYPRDGGRRRLGQRGCARCRRGRRPGIGDDPAGRRHGSHGAGGGPVADIP